MKIEKDTVVSLKYVLKDASGKVLMKAEDKPHVYLHGHEQIVPGLESALAGHAVGDKVKTIVKPEDGYGRKRSKGPQPVPRSAFGPKADLEVGQACVSRDEKGQEVVFFITSIAGQTVYVDHDHPFAGKKLHYDVEILEIRAATEDELKHGHAHGPDGHGHGHDDHDGDDHAGHDHG